MVGNREDTDMEEMLRSEKLEFYRQIIRDEKQKYPKIALLEGTSFYPAEAELFVDGVHPNDEGMQIYANALTKAIKQIW